MGLQLWVTQFRKGLVELCVMATLAEGEAYGYQIVERLGQVSGLTITESTVYPLLARLGRDGLLAVRSAPSSSGPPRRYYHLTESGREAAPGNGRSLAAHATVRQSSFERSPLMTTAQLELESPLQALVDDRLDAIDRVLLRAGVSRGERRTIVEEVEARGARAIIAKEQQRTSEGGCRCRARPPSTHRKRMLPSLTAGVCGRNTVKLVPRMRSPQLSLLAMGSAAGGAFATIIMAFLSILILQSEIGEIGLLLALCLLLPASLAVTSCGILAIVRIRRSEGWLFGLRAALFAAIIFPLLLGNGFLVVASFLFDGFGLVAVAILAVLACNAGLIYHVWKLLASGYQRATPVPESV